MSLVWGEPKSAKMNHQGSGWAWSRVFFYPSAHGSQTPNHNCFPNFMRATVHQKLGCVNLNEPHTTKFSTMFWTKENTGTQQTGLTKSPNMRSFMKSPEDVKLLQSSLLCTSQVTGSLDHKLDQTDRSSLFYLGP